jgi:hypothetical protein
MYWGSNKARISSGLLLFVVFALSQEMLDVELVLFTQRFVFTDLSAEIFEKNLV